MQAVSMNFSTETAANYREPQFGVLISWLKNIDPSTTFFQLDHSHLDGNDKLKGVESSVSFFDRYDYINESQYVDSFRITKKVSSRPWGVITAQADVVLNNASKRFMPGYDPIIGGNIVRDRPIKLSVGFNGEFINLFTGYTERPINTVTNRKTVLQCFDAMSYLSNKKSSLGTMINMRANEIIEELLIEQGFTSSQFNIEESIQQPIGYFMPKDRIVTEMIQELCEAEGALAFVDEQGIIQWWNRLHFIYNQTTQWSFDYDNTAGIEWDTTSIINDVSVNARPLKPAAYNKMFELADASDETMIPPGGSKDIFAEFRDDEGEFVAISVTDPVYVSSNVGTSVYSTNLSIDGSGAAGNAFITLDSTYNFGSKYRMTFSNSGTQPIYITNIQLYGQPAKVTAVSSLPQRDQTSIDEYGLNPDDGGSTIVIENNLVQDVTSANALGYMLVRFFSNPLARLTLNNFAVPQVQIGDSINITIPDTAESYDSQVMGYTIAMDYPAKLTQQLNLEQRTLQTYFQLDHSQLDGADRLAL